MADHLTDEEQLQVLKNWWKENGRFLIIVIAVALSAYAGFQWWNKYQQDYAENASSLYIELNDVVSVGQGPTLSDEKMKTAQFLIDQLQSEYGDTLYAANASLLAAKLAVDKADLPTAEQQLKKAIELGDEETQTIASLRLARVYLAQKNYDAALASASYDKNDSFSGLYAAVRGDILSAKGDTDTAVAAYQKALELLGSDNNLQHRLINIKLSDLLSQQGINQKDKDTPSGDKP